MALAISEREIETELRRLDANLCWKLHRANLIEEPEVVIAHRDCRRGAGNRFSELREDQSPAACGDGFACY